MLHKLLIFSLGSLFVFMVSQDHRFGSRRQIHEILVEIPHGQARHQALVLIIIAPTNGWPTEVVNRSLSTLLRVLIKKNLKNWEECIPHAEFAYKRAKYRITDKIPFMVVYGFEPNTALDLLPLPLHERVNMDMDKRADYMKKLHFDTRSTIEAQVLHQASRLNKNKKERIFEEGDLVWIHLRKDRFLEEQNSKLRPRGDDPSKFSNTSMTTHTSSTSLPPNMR